MHGAKDIIEGGIGDNHHFPDRSFSSTTQYFYSDSALCQAAVEDRWPAPATTQEVFRIALPPRVGDKRQVLRETIRTCHASR